MLTRMAQWTSVYKAYDDILYNVFEGNKFHKLIFSKIFASP